jgi:predicted ATPase
MLLMVECNGRVEHALEALESDQSLGAPLRAELHITLGFALLNTTGLAERTRTVLTRALDLADSLGDVALQLRALWATWSVYFNIGNYRQAQSAAQRLLDAANGGGDRDAVLVGHRILGSAKHFLGNQPEAQQHLDLALESKAIVTEQSRQLWYLLDQRVVARAMLARVLWLRGFVDQATKNARVSLEEAQAADDRLAICYALRNAVCPLALTIGDLATAERYVALLSDLVEKHGMAFWLGWASCLRGQLLLKRGEFAAGSTLLRAGLEARIQAGWMMRCPEFLGVLGEGLAGMGNLSEAAATIEEAIAQSNRGAERWVAPELLRVKGELILQGVESHSFAAAEACFIEALELSRLQDALFWELRVAMSLARLRLRQDRRQEALQHLAPVFDRFSEGFETADVQSAKRLLTTLA